MHNLSIIGSLSCLLLKHSQCHCVLSGYSKYSLEQCKTWSIKYKVFLSSRSCVLGTRNCLYDLFQAIEGEVRSVVLMYSSLFVNDFAPMDSLSLLSYTFYPVKTHCISPAQDMPRKSPKIHFVSRSIYCIQSVKFALFLSNKIHHDNHKKRLM